MKKLFIDDVQEGMVLGRPIYSNHGQLIMEANTVLTDKLISRLSFYDIYDLMIKEPEDDEAPTPQPTPQPTVSHMEMIKSRSQTIKQKPEFQKFQIEYTKEISSFQSTLANALENSSQAFDIDQLLSGVNGLMQSTASTMDLFDMLHNMRQIDDSIYAHSLNVALISRTLGKWLRFPEEELQVLTLSGLLHDIGKAALPSELLKKPGKYTPEEFTVMKRHPLLGYQRLMEKPLDIRVKNAVLMHHERCDGSGYPQGIKADQTDDFAMIVAIADVYDAMTAARSYREPLCPFQVIAEFERDGLQKYHPKYILTFLEHIADTYQHNRVLLNNGQSGTIVMINKQHLTQPYIQFSDGTIMDMTGHPELEIVAIL